MAVDRLGRLARLISRLDYGFVTLGDEFLAIRHAQTPADAEHRFGHGKAEALAALVQGAALSLAALFLVSEAVRAYNRLRESTMGIIVIAVSIILTGGLVMVQRRVAKATNSVAIHADSAHYAGDLYMNMGVIAALVLSGPMGFVYADPVLGLVVAGILAKSAWDIFPPLPTS